MVCNNCNGDSSIEVNSCGEAIETLAAPVECNTVQTSCPIAYTIDRQTAISNKDAFNIPLCNNNVTFRYDGNLNLSLDGFLWSEGLGYFKIISFDATIITIQNTCYEGNAAFGTYVPADVGFILSANPLEDLSFNNSFLGADFVAPPEDSCTTALLTSTDGLAPGIQIIISTGTYLLSAFMGGNTVELCNNGGGLTPGTLLQALDSFGSFQYPITVGSAGFILESDVYSSKTYLYPSTADQRILELQNSLLLINPSNNKTLKVFYKARGVYYGSIFNADPVTNISRMEQNIYNSFIASTSAQLESLVNNIHSVASVALTVSGALNYAGVVELPPNTFFNLQLMYRLRFTGPAVVPPIADFIMNLTAPTKFRMSAIGVLI